MNASVKMGTYLILRVGWVASNRGYVEDIKLNRFAYRSRGFSDDKSDSIVGKWSIASCRIDTDSGRWISGFVVGGRFQRRNVVVMVDRIGGSGNGFGDAFAFSQSKEPEYIES
jgi:hypothetical protein